MLKQYYLQTKVKQNNIIASLFHNINSIVYICI